MIDWEGMFYDGILVFFVFITCAGLIKLFMRMIV